LSRKMIEKWFFPLKFIMKGFTWYRESFKSNNVNYIQKRLISSEIFVLYDSKFRRKTNDQLLPSAVLLKSYKRTNKELTLADKFWFVEFKNLAKDPRITLEIRNVLCKKRFKYQILWKNLKLDWSFIAKYIFNKSNNFS